MAKDKKSEASKRPGQRRGGCLRRLVWGMLGALAAAIVLAVVFRAPLLRATARWLIVGRQPYPGERADAIVALGGADTRKHYALDLYQQGAAEHLVLLFDEYEQRTRPFGAESRLPEEALKYLTEEVHIPRERLRVLRGLTNTAHEAVGLRELAQQENWTHVFVVDSAFHTRRSRWILRRVFRDSPVKVTVVPVPLSHDHLTLDRWWVREREAVAVNNEYVKLLVYWWRYGGLEPGEIARRARSEAAPLPQGQEGAAGFDENLACMRQATG